MYQVFKTSKGIRTVQVPAPMLQDLEILVKTHFSLISTGTETASLKKSQGPETGVIRDSMGKFQKVKDKIKKDGLSAAFAKVSSKLISTEESLKYSPIGYSVAGEVVAVGKAVRNFNIGDRVACAGSGIAAHAEFVRIPINLAVKLPQNVLMDDAAFTTIGSIAMHGIRRASVQPGETIVVLGLGLIGQLAVQIAKSWGLNVIGIDLLEQRVSTSVNNGCDLGLLSNDPELSSKVLSFTKGYGADSVIIYAATKSSEPSNLALSLCRQKGRVVLVGSVGMELDRDLMYKKELDYVISTSYGPGRYDDLYEYDGVDYPIGYVRWTENRNMQEFVRLLSNGSIKTVPLVTGRFKITEAETAFDSLVKHPIDNLAVLLEYNPEPKTPEFQMTLRGSKADKAKIGVALVGAGGFAQRTHLPNLLKLSAFYSIDYIVDRKSEQALSVGKKYGAAKIGTDYREMLDDVNVDLVIITTQHNNHAEIVAESLRAGKSVLVEKPLAISLEQYKEVVKTLEDFPNANLFVGFNRRYSPFISKLKPHLTGSPKFINYRVNAGIIKADHWIQDPLIGGGRLIGEVCHFIDLINYMVGWPVTNFQISSIPVDKKKVHSHDNYSIILSYSDGSIGQINYTSLGSKSLSKERIEVHADSISIVIEDFVKMTSFGIPNLTMEVKESNKGHLAELEEIYKKLTGKQSQLPDLSLDLLATELSIQMVEKLNAPYS